MLYYSAYNLGIGSEIPLPEFAPADRGGDVEVRLSPPQPVTGSRSILWDAGSPVEVDFRYPGAGRFVVRHGRSVTIVPEQNVDLPLLRLYVQGMVFAALLHQRGLFVLHASIVQIGSSAIGFLGPVGAGKSTLAAGFHARGYPVAADDNAAIDLHHCPPTVMPAFPSLKLYPAVAAELGYSRSSLRIMHQSQTKRAHAITTGFHAQPAGLRAVYILDRGAPPAVRRLSPVETVVEMIRHSVPTRWGVAGDAPHLKMCSQLAGVLPAFRVRTFHNLPEIPFLIDTIAEHSAQFLAESEGSGQ
ncbi:MAG TPA: hypothetical protein VMB03_12375 [Bryobacteraceae bacterium]|nr:hypothetical protein [Bryobacteraceae bacterium]